MRRYQQFCPLARSLDLIGDRWSLLILRELAIRPCRYTDLRDGLPGIATNLLAERLRELQEAGIVRAEHAPPPVATTLYSLTEWGAELRPLLVQLGRWGMRLMASGKGQDHFRSRWVLLGASALYDGLDLSDIEPVTVLVESGGGGEPVLISAGPAGVTGELVPPGRSADVVITADPDIAAGLLTGNIAPEMLDPATRSQVRGSEDALRRLGRLTERARRAQSGGQAGEESQETREAQPAVAVAS